MTTTLVCVEFTSAGSYELGFEPGQRYLAPVGIARRWADAGWVTILDTDDDDDRATL